MGAEHGPLSGTSLRQPFSLCNAVWRCWWYRLCDGVQYYSSDSRQWRAAKKSVWIAPNGWISGSTSLDGGIVGIASREGRL